MKKGYQTILCLLFCIACSFSSSMAHAVYSYEVSVCAIFRDDARFLKEWIEFHRIVGVEHFWLFNNLSQDEYAEVLAPYVSEGIVDLIEWPYESQNWHHWHEIQNSAYDRGIELAKGVTKWLAFIDSDEFLFPVQKNHLAEVLNDYEDFGGVCANWQLFGTSGVQRIPDNQLMIELLTSKAQTDFWKNTFIKSIVRPERVDKFFSAHIPKFIQDYYNVTTKKKKVTSHKSSKISVDVLRINHYWTRDEDFFFERKVDRRDKPGSNFRDFLKEFDHLNEVQDVEIFRFVPQLKAKLYPQFNIDYSIVTLHQCVDSI